MIRKLTKVEFFYYYTVCQYFGLDTSDYSFPYIAGWSSHREMDALRSSMETVPRTAGDFIDGMEEAMRGLRPKPYLLEHGVHLYLWKDSENAEKNSLMPGFYDVLYMDSGHIVDTMAFSAMQLAEMWMGRKEYGKPLFNEGQRNLIINYAYMFDNRLDTRAFIKELAAELKKPGAGYANQILRTQRYPKWTI